ncbi:MAG: hypothetical protein HY301_17550 [Verrucomicrobia bacterium]|nr:hypothetical protein [Verrucomicrobiota bacterium]
MTATAPVLEKIWSRRQWATAVVIALGVQVGLVFVVSQRAALEPRRDPSATIVKFAGDAGDSVGADPTLFALANARGFSGRAWLQQPRPQHSLNDWQEPERWLAIPVGRFTEEFRQLARTNPVRSAAAVEQPPVRIIAPELVAPARPAASALNLSPTLVRRGLVAAPEISAWPGPDVLTDSVVQVVVDRSGDVLSARLIAGSGAKAADAQAVALASQVRFKTAGSELVGASPFAGVTVGDLIFHWQTVAPPAAKAAKPITP